MTPQFGRINRAAKGAMSPANYRDLYQEASALGKGTIVEIGPAQGAGTIVLGLAAKKNPNIEKIISIDAFEKSQHLISLDNVEDNIRELRKNLSSFHCGERVTIMTAGHEDWEMIKHSRITMLVIDADGGLDRDFSNYYNLLVPGATVFVDDYCAVLNEQAKNYYTRERTGCLDSPEEDAREYLHKPSPLGKQYMTKCFIDYLIREGLLEEKSIRNRTITLVKSKTNPFFTEKHLSDMQQIRARMKEKLLSVRRETLRIVRQLDPQLERIQAAAECEELLVMRGIPVDHDIRYYPVYGLGKNGKPASDIGRIYEKHIRDSVSGERQFILLKRGRRRNKEKYALVICGQAGKKPFMLPSDWKKKLTATLNTVEEETQTLFRTTDLSSLKTYKSICDVIKMANKPVKLVSKKSAAIAFVLLFSIAAAALLINMLFFSNSRENADFEWGGYARKDEQWWGSPECVEIADEMIRHQRSDGGWAKSIQTPPWDIWRHSTIDNTMTWGQVRFLAKCYSATGKDAYRESCRRGISFLLNMQYENGGWPQIADAEGTYHAHITFNDDAMTGVMETLNMVSQRSETDGFGWMDDATAQKAGEAFDKGLDCILKCQIRVGGTLTAWCQQYDETTLSPASGRAYEPASICTKESSGVVKLLQKLPEKTPEVSAGIDAAIKWFDAVKIEGVRFEQIGDDRQLVPGSPEDVLWARFYQLDGATPLFADRDGEEFDDISKISMERRAGYDWYGIWPLEILK